MLDVRGVVTGSSTFASLALLLASRPLVTIRLGREGLIRSYMMSPCFEGTQVCGIRLG